MTLRALLRLVLLCTALFVVPGIARAHDGPHQHHDAASHAGNAHSLLPLSCPGGDGGQCCCSRHVSVNSTPQRIPAAPVTALALPPAAPVVQRLRAENSRGVHFPVLLSLAAPRAPPVLL